MLMAPVNCNLNVDMIVSRPATETPEPYVQESVQEEGAIEYKVGNLHDKDLSAIEILDDGFYLAAQSDFNLLIGKMDEGVIEGYVIWGSPDVRSSCLLGELVWGTCKSLPSWFSIPGFRPNPHNHLWHCQWGQWHCCFTPSRAIYIFGEAAVKLEIGNKGFREQDM
ncbi:hypothetical protein V6N13_090306 [Hibiscus sabdariffa]